MDGFFEKYGWLVVAAVAVCFVLLFLTPLRNIIGSSINGMVQNFASTVTNALNTFKVPNIAG